MFFPRVTLRLIIPMLIQRCIRINVRSGLYFLSLKKRREKHPRVKVESKKVFPSLSIFSMSLPFGVALLPAIYR